MVGVGEPSVGGLNTWSVDGTISLDESMMQWIYVDRSKDYIGVFVAMFTPGEDSTELIESKSCKDYSGTLVLDPFT